MPLNKVLEEWDRPVKPDIIKEVIAYMKTMPKEENEQLLVQCAEHLDKTQTLGAVMAVVHALNDGEIFLRCRDEDALLESDLSAEFERLLGEDDKKKYCAISSLTLPPVPSSHHEAACGSAANPSPNTPLRP